MKKHIRVDCEWGKQSDSKECCKDTIDKKAEPATRKHDSYVSREVKVFESPGKRHECLRKNERHTIDIDDCRSLVNQLMFFTAKLGPNLDNETPELSGFMESPGTTHWVDQDRTIGCVDRIEVKCVFMWN